VRWARLGSLPVATVIEAVSVAVAALALAACAHQAPPPPPTAAPVVRQTPPPSEPREEMAVSGTLGTLSDDEIAGPFQRRWDEIIRCYDDATQRIDYLGGRIELKLRVAASGESRSAYVVGSTLGNWDAERCVLGVARGLHFARPHGGTEAEFTYPIEFRGKRPVQTWEGGRVEPSLLRHKRDVSVCKARLPAGLPPSLTLTMYVAPGGKVTSAGLAADAPLDDAFATCLLGKTRLWRLEDPLGKIAKTTVGVGD
jgi:hypothetical protein